MNPSQAFDRRDEVQFLDVREHYEYDAGHIEDSLHIPMSQLNTRADEIAADRTVVVVCRSGNRSALVTNALNRGGWQAENLDGGMIAWARAELPITSPSGRVGQVA